MAVATTSNFSNGFPGFIQLLQGDIYRKDASPAFNVGQMYMRADGNLYVYAHFGADTNAGLLVSQDLSESAVVDTDNVVIAPASATLPAGQVIQPGDTNSFQVQVTLASVTQNQFAGGILHITADTGEGHSYRIKGNTATGDPVSGDIRLELYDRIQVALDATSDIAISGNIAANVEAATAATDPVIAGVSVSTMDVSAAAYGFIQASGIATILTDGVVVIGNKVTLSDGVAGAVQLDDAKIEPSVGYVIIVGDDTEHSAIKLQLL